MKEQFKATEYSGMTQFYFDKILRTSIEIGDLDNEARTILDFGCGHQRLKLLSSNKNIVGYDRIKNLTDIDDWTSVAFNTFVAVEVLCVMTSFEIRHVMETLLTLEEVDRLVIGSSRLGRLNKLGMLVTGRSNAHDYVKTTPAQEAKIILDYFKASNTRSIYGLCDVTAYERR
jgi:hypothetical protein